LLNRTKFPSSLTKRINQVKLKKKGDKTMYGKKKGGKKGGRKK
tara:strand:- start:15 stop:143 length:129 start_codon:yes stop_codon:yes gene_type:complete